MPWNRFLLERLANQNVYAFYGTLKFLTVFTTDCHFSLSWARLNHTPSPSIFVSSILILTFHLCLSHPSGLFPSGLPAKILYAHVPYMPHDPPISFLFIWLPEHCLGRMLFITYPPSVCCYCVHFMPKYHP